MNLKNLEYIKKNAPATKEEIENVEKHINGVLPKIYKEFLRQAIVMVLDLCVLYDTHRIVESYECNEFADYAPGYISIGNDNGDRELIIKAENVSKDNCYIQYVRFNNKRLSNNYIEWSKLKIGGTLHFIMGDRPNPNAFK